jgi:predicted transcriptional regulator
MRVSSEVALERDVLRALVTGGPCSTRRLKAHISFVLSEDQVQEVLNRLVESELVTKMEGARDERRYVASRLGYEKAGFASKAPCQASMRRHRRPREVAPLVKPPMEPVGSASSC